jgi:tRNA(fMet)-specific endonuclease VapC
MIASRMLDTNIVSDAIRNPNGAAARQLSVLPAGACCISIITLIELRFGAAKVGARRLSQQIDGFLDLIETLPLERPVEVAYSRIRVELEATGRPIGQHDLLIAAHALSLDLTVVTANVREFARVPGLKVENWLD